MTQITKAVLLKVDGTKKFMMPKNGTDFQLDELYELLECDMIERITLDEGLIMIIDEEGKLKNDCKINVAATEGYQICYPPVTDKEAAAYYRDRFGEDTAIIDLNEGMDETLKNSIVGNAIVCPESMLK